MRGGHRCADEPRLKRRSFPAVRSAMTLPEPLADSYYRAHKAVRTASSLPRGQIWSALQLPSNLGAPMQARQQNEPTNLASRALSAEEARRVWQQDRDHVIHPWQNIPGFHAEGAL